jgi:hypothetical protein
MPATMHERAPQPWQRVDPLARQRARWLALARDEAEAASRSGEHHIAGAFRIVVATIEADRAIAPPVNGRDVLKGRAEARERAIALASEGLSSRAVAAAVDQPYGTVYAWLRDAGVVTPRAVWLGRVRRRRSTAGVVRGTRRVAQ